MTRILLAVGLWTLMTVPVRAQELPRLPEVEEVPVIMSVRFYDVEGRRYRHAVEALRYAGPQGYDAVTNTMLRTYYEFSPSEQGCALRVLELPLEVEILYPRWLGYDNAPRADRESWDRRMHVLTVHENLHALIAFLGAISAYNDLASVGARDNCERLEAILRETVDTTNDRISRWQRDYDRVTRHDMEQPGFDFNAFMDERL